MQHFISTKSDNTNNQLTSHQKMQYLQVVFWFWIAIVWISNVELKFISGALNYDPIKTILRVKEKYDRRVYEIIDCRYIGVINDGMTYLCICN